MPYSTVTFLNPLNMPYSPDYRNLQYLLIGGSAVSLRVIVRVSARLNIGLLKGINIICSSETKYNENNNFQKVNPRFRGIIYMKTSTNQCSLFVTKILSSSIQFPPLTINTTRITSESYLALSYDYKIA